jgi:hypothetical protein
MPMTVEARQRIERRIARRTIKEAIAAGYKLGVHNGEELVIRDSTNVPKILAEMFTTDEEHLFFYNAEGKRVGWVFFVYGNDGWDVICDYTTNLEDVMERVQVLSDKLCERYFNR